MSFNNPEPITYRTTQVKPPVSIPPSQPLSFENTALFSHFNDETAEFTKDPLYEEFL
jgi:hypothetical protein